MATPNLADISELERRKRVRIRLRPDLSFVNQKYEGRTFYVVKDPVCLRYYRFKEHERYLLDYMDGDHTLEDAQKAFEQRFRPERLTLEDLEAFTSQLLQAGLAQNETPNAGKALYDRYKKRQRKKIVQTLMNVMYIKIPVIDPDRILEQMRRGVLRIIFTTWFFALSVAVAVAALGLVLTHWDVFWAKLPAQHEFFSFKSVVYLWAALGVVKVIHEFGHGLSCKTFGGEVHEMGALFLVFSPCLYCNVSDAWTLPNKWHRIIISAAGIYVELIIAALATFVWWGTESGSFVNNLSMSLMVVCSVSTVFFNANPLMRFDGYYVLADWIEIPNLREKSNRYLQHLAMEYGLGIEVPPQPYMTRGRQILFVTYAVVSYVYRWVVTFSVLVFMYTFLEPYKLGAISFLLGTAALASMVGMPLYQLGKAVHRRGRIPDMKPLRVTLSAAAVAAALVFLFFVPLPMKVRGLAVVQVDPRQATAVVAPEVGGFLRDLYVQDGARVKAGDILAQLSSPQLEMELKVNRREQTLRHEQVNSIESQMGKAASLDAKLTENYQTAQSELETLSRTLRELERLQDHLTIRAPRDGVVMRLVGKEEIGKAMEKGALLCYVGDKQALRAAMLVPPESRSLIKEGDTAWIRVHGLGVNAWPATVSSIAAAEAKEIPQQLSNKVSGDIATQADAETRTEKPQSQHFLVAVRFDEPGEVIQPGVMARVKIEGPPRSLWWRVNRYLSRNFNLGL